MSKIGLVIAMVAETGGLSKGLDEGGRKVTAFGKSFDVGMIAKATVATGVILAVTDAVAGMTSAAIADEAEQARLAAAIEASGAAHGDYAAQVEASIAAGQALAFTDTEIRDALVPLIAATGDVTEAQTQLALAQDLARLKGVDLETAAIAVGKAYDGNATSLSKLAGFNAKGMSSTDALAEAQRLAAGQAETYSKSTEGSLAAGSIAFDELTESIGSAFIPIVQELVPVIAPLLTQLGKLVQAILPLLIPLIRIVGQVLGVIVTVITKVVDVVIDLVTWFGKLVDQAGDVLDAVNPLKGIGDFVGGIVGSRGIAGPAALAVGGLGARAAVPAVGGGTVVNIYGATGEDVIATLRRYVRLNGGNVGTLLG